MAREQPDTKPHPGIRMHPRDLEELENVREFVDAPARRQEQLRQLRDFLGVDPMNTPSGPSRTPARRYRR